MSNQKEFIVNYNGVVKAVAVTRATHLKDFLEIGTYSFI